MKMDEYYVLPEIDSTTNYTTQKHYILTLEYLLKCLKNNLEIYVL